VRTLVEKVVGTVTVAEVVELPWLTGWASASDRILIDQDLDSPEIAGEVVCILVGLASLVGVIFV